MRHTAPLQQWNDEQGYGFVPLPQGGRAFVHIGQFAEKTPRPSTGVLIGFELRRDPQGRWQAVRCQQLRPAPTATSPAASAAAASRVPAGAIGGLVLLGLAGLGLAGVVPGVVWLWCALASVVSVGLYGWDKSRARTGGPRIPENTLHLWSLLGGWPGALLAQQGFRHKTRKQPFRRLFWVTVGLNLLALGLLAWLGQAGFFAQVS